MPHTQHNPQALARDVAAAMWARDRATQALAMQIVRVAPGEAVISMPVSAERAMISDGIMPKKLPMPMLGSRTRPPANPARCTISHMASTTGGSV